MFNIDLLTPDNILDLKLDNPTTGDNISYTIKGDDKECMLLLSMSFKLTSSAVAATRKVALRFENRAGSNLWELNNETGQIASLAYTYYAGLQCSVPVQNGGWSSTAGTRTAGLPGIILIPGDIVSTYTLNKDSGDAFTDVSLRFLRSTPGRF